MLSATNHEFREWLEKAHDKGLRGLFRSLRQKDHAWQRPFQNLPSTLRTEAREQQWGAIWKPLEGPLQVRGLMDLRREAQAQALQQKGIDSSLLQKIMRKLPNKAAGPDGISYDFLRHLPYPAVERLAKLLTEMEQEAELPLQMRHTNIVMIPKNERIERPIALTSCLYRLWNSYRKHDLQKWQLGLDKDMPWDHARPHKDCLSIAIGRMLKAEIGKRNGIHTVTCLADLTCFYDTVQLDHLIEPARDLQYPPLHLKLASGPLHRTQAHSSRGHCPATQVLSERHSPGLPSGSCHCQAGSLPASAVLGPRTSSCSSANLGRRRLL